MVGLIDVKWKGSELIWYWADYMTLPFDHTHNVDLRVSRSESKIALSKECGGRLTMNEKDESSIHDHDIDLCDHIGVGECTW